MEQKIPKASFEIELLFELNCFDPELFGEPDSPPITSVAIPTLRAQLTSNHKCGDPNIESPTHLQSQMRRSQH